MDKSNEKPNGGMPPIIRCLKEDLEIIDKSKNREYAVVKSVVSIKDLLKKKIAS